MRFVRTTENQYGIGKLVDGDEQTSLVEYFDSPTAAERLRISVKTSSLVRVRLAPQTRVYFLDLRSGNWRVGRIVDHVDLDCFIALPNDEPTARVHEADVYTRWYKPIEDPTAHLAARVTETPFFHVGRCGLMAMLIQQRAASSGLTGLLSAPVSIERHQVEVVRRVLQDSVQRYLLADEVGLGKTIEAGVIIRQHVLDHPESHSVLIVVPEQLVEQWDSELCNRLQVGPAHGHQVEIVTFDKLAEADRDKIDANMVVVDEAHQAVVGWDRPKDSAERKCYETLCAITAQDKVPRLLLLSATPVRGNEDGFLAMLHLLDPALHRLTEREAFREKVEKRQALADIFYLFREETAEYFLEQMAADLTGMFPADQRLAGLLANLAPLIADTVSSERPSAIRAVRTHLSETYRLHRRLLRNRRTRDIEDLLPGRAGVSVRCYNDAAAHDSLDALEHWRANAMAATWNCEQSAEAQAIKTIWTVLLEAALCDLEALGKCAAARLGEEIGGRYGWLTSPERIELLQSVPFFEGEETNLRSLAERLDPEIEDQDPNEARIDAILAAAEAILMESPRLVVFASSPHMADRVAKRLNLWLQVKVWRHKLEKTEWRTFRDASAEGVLVCDYRAEEGLNLQGGRAAILHADLPLSPNKLEQRMGRLDRYGVGEAVRSHVLLPNDCEPHDAWLACLKDTYKVFDRSIAALQYVVEDEMHTMRSRLLAEGTEALREVRTRLEGLLEKELKAIQAQDELDSIDVAQPDEDEDVTRRIETLDETHAKIGGACAEWLCGKLHFKWIGDNGPQDKVTRYHYLNPDSSRSPTLVPRTDMARFFGRALDRDSNHQFTPVTFPLAFDRNTARHRNVGVGRIGNPVIDSLQDYLRWDDRGTAFAFWRQVSTLSRPIPAVYFRFDMVLEADLAEIDKLRARRPILRETALRRRADAAFPPIVRSIWVDEDMTPLEQSPPGTEERFDSHGGRDWNLNWQRWELVRRQYNLAPWKDLCMHAAGVAREALVKTEAVVELTCRLARALEAETEIAREQWQSRLQALTDRTVEREFAEQELNLEMEIREALLVGVRNPRLRIDAAGAVFLSTDPLE